jgi:hypothetical protein
MDLFPFTKIFSLLYHRQDFYWTSLWVTRQVSYKKQELLSLREHLGSPLVFWSGQCCSSFYSFLCCVLVVWPHLCLVLNITCFSGLSIFDCPFGFLLRLFKGPQDGCVLYIMHIIQNQVWYSQKQQMAEEFTWLVRTTKWTSCDIRLSPNCKHRRFGCVIAVSITGSKCPNTVALASLSSPCNQHSRSSLCFDITVLQTSNKISKTLK